MEQTKQSSYTSANAMPSKIFHNIPFLKNLHCKDRIIPIHVQLIPTNKCNLNCSFCSFSDADRKIELSLQQIQEILDILHSLGTLSITWTGGGDPLMHPMFPDMIQYASEHLIESGLVTNGILINKLKQYYADLLTWCRISASDERRLSERNKQENIKPFNAN